MHPAKGQAAIRSGSRARAERSAPIHSAPGARADVAGPQAPCRAFLCLPGRLRGGNARFEAIETANADEAIRILESRNDIRIVFTNIEMPGSMDGVKLAACVRDRWPPIEIILTSGYLTAKDVALPARVRPPSIAPTSAVNL
jgi:CheY-like chemotaxis protein